MPVQQLSPLLFAVLIAIVSALGGGVDEFILWLSERAQQKFKPR
jgi:hypothetical protein